MTFYFSLITQLIDANEAVCQSWSQAISHQSRLTWYFYVVSLNLQASDLALN